MLFLIAVSAYFAGAHLNQCKPEAPVGGVGPYYVREVWFVGGAHNEKRFCGLPLAVAPPIAAINGDDGRNVSRLSFRKLLGLPFFAREIKRYEEGRSNPGEYSLGRVVGARSVLVEKLRYLLGTISILVIDDPRHRIDIERHLLPKILGGYSHRALKPGTAQDGARRFYVPIQPWPLLRLGQFVSALSVSERSLGLSQAAIDQPSASKSGDDPQRAENVRDKDVDAGKPVALRDGFYGAPLGAEIAIFAIIRLVAAGLIAWGLWMSANARLRLDRISGGLIAVIGAFAFSGIVELLIA